MARELLNNTLRKVLPFEQTGDFFYRKARKSLETNNYINALNYYRKALEKEPDNIEYSLDLAEVYTEMSYYNESNRILFSILQKDSTAIECYFGIGCNFLGLHDYKKAEECLERYLNFDSYGLYSDEAADLLEILQNQDYYFNQEKETDPERAQLLADASRGKSCLDKGEFKKAIRVLEKVLEGDKDLIFARNNLALAYYCDGDIDRAINACKQILSKYPNNVHANCNLAIFYKDAGDVEASKKHISRVLALSVDEPEDLYKIVVTLCEFKEHEKANKLLEKLIQYKPYDTNILHYMAVSFFNLKSYKKALQYWDKIEKINPGNTISNYYRRYTRGILDGARSHTDLAYHFQVPYDEIIRRVKKINEILKLSDADLMARWTRNKGLYDLLSWGLDLDDTIIKHAILNLVASFADKRAENFIRDFLMTSSGDKDNIRQALTLLKGMGAVEPYMAMIDGEIVEIKVSLEEKYILEDPLYDSIPRLAINGMRERNLTDMEDGVNAVWNHLLHYWHDVGMPRIQKLEGWAAAIDLYYCENTGVRVSKKELAEYYNISYSTLYKNYRYIQEAVLDLVEFDVRE